MVYVSPSFLKEYLFCSRYFFNRKIHQLIPLMDINLYAQKRIVEFTSGFFSLLEYRNGIINQKTLFDLECLLRSETSVPQDINLRELDEKIFTLISWLIGYLSEESPLNVEHSLIFLFMVNEFIRTPRLNLQGRPSRIFKQPNSSALVLIQTKEKVTSFMQNYPILPAAALFARILETMGKTQKFLYVNYFTIDPIFNELKPIDLGIFNRILNNFRTAVKEENFDPPGSPTCEICKFQWICKLEGEKIG